MCIRDSEHTNHVFTAHWLCVYSTLTIELGGHCTLTKVAIPHHCLRLVVSTHLVATVHQLAKQLGATAHLSVYTVAAAHYFVL